MRVSLRDAISARQRSARSAWHVGSSSHVTTNPDHAASRIHAGFCDVMPVYAGPKLRPGDAVFVMGSGFARELESDLLQRGRVVSSTGPDLEAPEFRDKKGVSQRGVFDRTTPCSMLQEFRIGFGALPGWDIKASLLTSDGSKTVDLNYGPAAGCDMGYQAVVLRRRTAQALAQRASEAKLIVLAPGSTEGWVHAPTGFHLNRFDAAIERNPGAYLMRRQDSSDALQSLDDIYQLIRSNHRTGDFQLAVAVSPVPLQATFSSKDVVIANMDAKAALRAAAAELVKRHHNVSYFPAFELVSYTATKQAWRADRLHLQPQMIEKLASLFVETYYEPGSIASRG